MKAWFVRFRVSAALDRALKATAPRTQPPPGLHRAIMRAVADAAPPAPALVRLALLRWLAVPAFAGLALAATWLAVRGPARPAAPEPQSLAAAATALDMGGQVPRVVPFVVVGPLTEELEGLNRDLNNTAKFLLASLP